MQRVDALAVARVADDKSMRIKLVAQVMVMVMGWGWG